MEQQGFFSADNGNRSYSRLSGFILIIAFVLWGTYITYIKEAIPDMPISLAGTIVTLYGLNKALSKKDNQDSQETVQLKEEIK